jgi:hypothetical protein
LLIGLVVAFVRELLRGPDTTPEQVQAALGIPVIGWIEKIPRRQLAAMRKTAGLGSPIQTTSLENIASDRAFAGSRPDVAQGKASQKVRQKADQKHHG